MSDGNVEHMGAGGMEAVDAPHEPALFSSPSPQRDPCGLVPRAASAGMEIARVRRRRQATAFDVASRRLHAAVVEVEPRRGAALGPAREPGTPGLPALGPAAPRTARPPMPPGMLLALPTTGTPVRSSPTKLPPAMEGRGARRTRGWPLLGRREPADSTAEETCLSDRTAER